MRRSAANRMPRLPPTTASRSDALRSPLDSSQRRDNAPPPRRFHFFTMDVAKRVDGGWMIVELGDAQVAGLPWCADVGAFYRALADRLG